MKKRLLCGLLTFAMVLSMLIVVPATTVVADTYNVSDNPVLITTLADFKAFRDAVNSGTTFSGKTVKLCADLNISDADWTPIGNAEGKPFKGSFDGQWHTITGLTQARSSARATSADTGLFGYVQAPASGTITIKNFNLVGVSYGSYNIKADKGCLNVGTVISQVLGATSSTINISGIKSSIQFDASSTTESNCVGGILGAADKNSGSNTINIDSCWFDGFLNSSGSAVDRRYGGILGYSDYSNNTVNVTNCLVTGTLKINHASADDIGGIVGFYRGSSKGSIQNCIFAGTIWNTKTFAKVGYVLGEVGGSPSPKITISNTYYVANYTGTAPAGSYGYGSSSYLTNSATSKTLAEVKALTSGFSDNTKWYFGSTNDTPVPFALAPFLSYDDAVRNCFINGSAGSNTWSASGTTHTITTDADMASFAAAVNGGNAFSGHTILLASDVVLRAVVGHSSSKPFSGNFNGQGHTVAIYQGIQNPDGDGGLFSFVRTPAGGTVTIQNVHITGKISVSNNTTGKGYCAGLISCVDANTSGSGGTLNVLNCWSSVRIDAGASNAWYAISGFIGFTRHAADVKALTINMDSCLWDGVINVGPQTDYFGGFIAYTGNQAQGSRTLTLNITNSMVAGQIWLNHANSDDTGLLTGYLKGNGTYNTANAITATFRNIVVIGKFTSSVDLNTSKWNTSLFQVSGTTTVTMQNIYYIAHTVRNRTMTAYEQSGGTVTGSATSKTLNEIKALTCEDFSENGKWVNKGSCLNGSSYESGLPMPAGIYGVFMASGYSKFYDSTAPTYDIANDTDMMNFAKAVNEGCVYFTGKTVRLTADIDLSGKTWQSIGRRYNNGNGACFRGTFDGQGHSIANMTITSDLNQQGAFFGFLGDGAVIKQTWFKAPASGYNITIPATSGTLYFQGILANACYGTVQITDVRNSMKLTASKNIGYSGAFVGFMDHTVNTTLTISGCVFDGAMNFGNYTQIIGGFVGTTGNNNGTNKTLVIENSVYAGTINLNANTSLDSVAPFLGVAHLAGSGNTSVTIRNCIAANRIIFNTDVSWDKANYGDCGQVIGTVDNHANVSYTITNVYYNPSYLHTTAGTAATKRFLGEIGSNKGTHTVDVPGAHFCSPSDFGALTLADLGGSGWTVPANSGTTINVPVPTYVGSTFGFSKSYTGQYWQTTAEKSTSTYNGSIIYTASFYNTAGSLGITNLGSRNANCGVILISNTKFKALSNAGAITFATLTASGCGTQVKALKYSGDSTCYTMRVVLKNFTTYTAKQSEEYFAIPYITVNSTPTIQLDGARLVSYSAL